MFMQRFSATCFAPVLCFSAGYAAEAQENPAVMPVKPFKMERHEHFLKIVAKGEGDVIFLGDSITQRWESDGAKVWAETFKPFKPVNLGIGGEQTSHVLWRITEGKELAPLTPKLAVLMIGTNNTHTQTAEQVAEGVKAIVAELRKQKPTMKILVLGVFPRSVPALKLGGLKEPLICPADKISPIAKAINTIIAKLADDKLIFYKDLTNTLLNNEGGLDRKIMHDFVHLTAEGYKVWADAIKGDIAKLVTQSR